MFPGFCGAPGFAGWLAMVLLWVGVIAAVVWGIARLFPQRPAASPGGAPARERDGSTVGRP